jgi:hypothetical protein
MVNGDYRSSNYTMSSDDEVFNVSNIWLTLYLFQFPPIKKQIGGAGGLKESSVIAYSNQIPKPLKKKPNPKLTMNMAGLSGINAQN